MRHLTIPAIALLLGCSSSSEPEPKTDGVHVTAGSGGTNAYETITTGGGGNSTNSTGGSSSSSEGGSTASGGGGGVVGQETAGAAGTGGIGAAGTGGSSGNSAGPGYCKDGSSYADLKAACDAKKFPYTYIYICDSGEQLMNTFAEWKTGCTTAYVSSANAPQGYVSCCGYGGGL